MSDKLKKQLRTLILAAVLFFGIFVLEKSGAAPFLFDRWWAALLLYLIPYLLCGWNVVRKAVLGVLHGQMLDECFLMTLASIGAFVTGEYEEAAAVMLFYQIGEWFQSYALGRTRQSISELMEIAPEYANVEREDGTVEQIDPDDVEEGDILVIKAGEKIPVDAEVLSGESLINTAALTGESRLQSAGPGSSVISGCINGDGLLRVRAQKCYEDSTVARILEMVENAAEKKSRTESFITRFARVYTPVVVVCALLLAIVPGLLQGDFMTWLYRACTFLVISCPCALVISVPLAFFGGIGAASRSGVLVKGSDYLEQLSKLTTVLSDKTGTLTKGDFAVSSLLCAEGVKEEEVLLYAALAEGTSTHPIAASIREAARRRGLLLEDGSCGTGGFAVTSSETTGGMGVAAVVDEREICVGSGRFMEKKGIPYAPTTHEEGTVVYVGAGGRYLGAILIRDELKEEAAEAIAGMRREGVKRFVMLTGDRKETGEAVARELGIDEVCAGLLPGDKVDRLEALLNAAGDGDVLAFIGDGINDAPVLMRADVGIAMGSLGSDAAIEAADVVIMDDSLKRVPAVMRIARRTIRIARQNIVFALAVKLLILILGALGYANMWAAVFADVGVAVLCILNSMRLLMLSDQR